MRLTVGLEDRQKTEARQQKRKSLESENTPPAKKVHGYTEEHIETLINTDRLLQEAKSWSPTESINWSAIGTNYGLTSPNRGQIHKEYLAQYDTCSYESREATPTIEESQNEIPGWKNILPPYANLSRYKKQKSM